MPQSSILPLSPVYSFKLDGSVPEISLPIDSSKLPADLEYEIEDEYGRKIRERFVPTPILSLPRLNAGYHHLKILGENLFSEALLLMFPPQIYNGTKKIKISRQIPVNDFKSLRRRLSEDNLEALHYTFPFPCEDDLGVFFRLIQKKNPNLEKHIFNHEEQALYLALRSQMPINKDFYDWANNHFDYNKINSFKTKEFAKKHADLVTLGELALAEVDNCLRDITAFCRRHNCPVYIHVDMPLAANVHEFNAWRDRKLFLSKQLSIPNYSDYVPYSPQALEGAFYEPFIALMRRSMAQADILFFDNPLYLQQLSCLDAPFPDKIIQYDYSALLAIVAIESNRSRCIVVAQDSPDLPEEFRNCLISSGIILV